MDFALQRQQQQDAARMMMFQNSGYQFERRNIKTLILDEAIGSNSNFDVELFEPLIVDKLSDIYLDSFTTFDSVANTSVANISFLLQLDQFNIQSNCNIESKSFNKLIIPNESGSTGKCVLHKSKKMNYICSINPTKIHNLSGKITLIDGTTVAFDSNGKFIAEFVIVARE
jgi:hypothetical protein